MRNLMTKWILMATIPLIGCVPPEDVGTEEEAAELVAGGPIDAITHAVAIMRPTAGHEASGMVHFYQEPEGMRVVAEMTGLTPGFHGFHVHELGDCSAPDGTSAGGHFNPDDHPHGAPTDTERHVGDLGNLSADEDGTGVYNQTDPVLSFLGSHGILGRAVIIHAGEDDYTSQPTGDAGARVACGVIGVASPQAEG